MQFLHEHKPAIIHRDLKTLNILIQGVGLKAKLADFGLARSLVGSFLSTMHVAGSPAWMAPEVLNGENVSTASDVYSFGVLMWEVATRQIPWDGCTYADVVREVGVLGKTVDVQQCRDAWRQLEDEAVRELASANTFAPLADVAASPGHAPLLGDSKQFNHTGEFIRLLESCLASDAKKRPSFRDVSAKVKQLLKMCPLAPKLSGETSDSSTFSSVIYHTDPNANPSFDVDPGMAEMYETL